MGLGLQSKPFCCYWILKDVESKCGISINTIPEDYRLLMGCWIVLINRSGRNHLVALEKLHPTHLFLRQGLFLGVLLRISSEYLTRWM